MQSKALTFGKGKLLLAAAVIALVVAALVPGMAFAADYTVTFDSAGGSAVKSQTVAAGGKITKPTDPTREHFTFVGWYDGGDFSDEANIWEFDNEVVNKNLVLVAKWKLNNDSTTVYRLYNKWSGEHLFTNDKAEYDSLGKLGWTQEDVGWVSDQVTKVPVYRLYNKYSGDHHYTTSLSEYTNLGKIGWTPENVAFYSREEPDKTPLASSDPVYRGFNPYEQVGTHHYTLDYDEFKKMVANGWRDEGVGWWVAETA